MFLLGGKYMASSLYHEVNEVNTSNIFRRNSGYANVRPI